MLELLPVYGIVLLADWLFSDNDDDDDDDDCNIAAEISYNEKQHRTKSKQLAGTFTFSYIKIGKKKWRIYIEKSPSYRHRSDDLHSTHRYYDHSRNQHYICWSKNIKKLADAKAISEKWAACTSDYILEGITF